MLSYRPPNKIGGQEATGGTETSKYPEEEKSTEIPGVAASETGPAQTAARVHSVRAFPRRGCWARCEGAASPSGCDKPAPQGNGLGRPAEQGESPVPEEAQAAEARSQSTAGHVKPGGKQGGPPSKAEHSPATDSEPVPRGKGEKHPERGVKQRLKPRAPKQSEHPSRCDGVPFVE